MQDFFAFVLHQFAKSLLCFAESGWCHFEYRWIPVLSGCGIHEGRQKLCLGVVCPRLCFLFGVVCVVLVEALCMMQSHVYIWRVIYLFFIGTKRGPRGSVKGWSAIYMPPAYS